jgi:hypothetical protein
MMASGLCTSISTSGRVEYLKRVGRGRYRRVICDVGADGQADFADQEAGEVHWYTFQPSAEDWQAVRWLLSRGEGAPRMRLEDILADLEQDRLGHPGSPGLQ